MAFDREALAAYEQQPQTMTEITAPAVEVAADLPVEPVADEATPATDGADADVTADGESSADETVDGDTATPSGETSAATEAPKGSARARIMELVDQRDAYKKFGSVAEQRIADLQSRLDAAEGKKPAAVAETPVAVTPTADDDPAPSPEDPDIQYDPVKLQQKNAAWLKRQVASGVKAGVAEALNTDKTATAQVVARQAFDKRVEAFEATPEGKDFRALVGNKELPTLLLPARQLIGRDDMGPAILHAIASDLAAAKELAAQPVEVQIMRIGEIKAELKLKAKAAPAAAATTTAAAVTRPVVKPKTVTSAPPPPTRVPGGSATQTRSLSDPSLSMDEFVRLDREARNAERAAKRAQRGLR